MTHLADFVTCRNGGIDFTVSGTSIDGRYRILNPREPQIAVLRDGCELSRSAPEMAEVQRLLEDWLHHQMSPDATAALAELDSLPQWRNLPDRLSGVVLLHRVRWVLQRLQGQAAEPGATSDRSGN